MNKRQGKLSVSGITSPSDIGFLLKHSTIYGFGTMLAQLAGFIMLPIYTRYLTPTDYGILNLIEISTFLLGMIITTGIAQTLSRFYYDSDDEKERARIVSTMYVTYITLSLIVLPVLLLSSSFLAGKILESSKYAHFFHVSFISFVLGGLLDIGLTYLRIKEKSTFFVFISVTRLAMLLSLNVYFVVLVKLGIMGILYSVLITCAFYQLVLTIPILLKVKVHFSLEYALSMLKFSIPLIPAQLANTFVNQSDRYFIRYFVSIADMGIYSLAQKLGTAVHLIVTCSFQSAFEPKRFEIARGPEAKETFNRIFVYHTLILTSVGLMISVYIPEVLRVMVTPEYYGAGHLVPLIVFSMVLFGFRNHFEFGILWSKKTHYYAFVNGIMSVLSICFNFIFVWTLGLWGAVYASTLTIFIHTILIYIFGKKLYFIQFDFPRIAKLFTLAFLAYGISLVLNTDYILFNLIAKTCLMVGFIFYLFKTKVISEREGSMFKAKCFGKVKLLFGL